KLHLKAQICLAELFLSNLKCITKRFNPYHCYLPKPLCSVKHLKQVEHLNSLTYANIHYHSFLMSPDKGNNRTVDKLLGIPYKGKLIDQKIEKLYLRNFKFSQIDIFIMLK